MSIIYNHTSTVVFRQWSSSSSQYLCFKRGCTGTIEELFQYRKGTGNRTGRNGSRIVSRDEMLCGCQRRHVLSKRPPKIWICVREKKLCKNCRSNSLGGGVCGKNSTVKYSAPEVSSAHSNSNCASVGNPQKFYDKLRFKMHSAKNVLLI